MPLPTGYECLWNFNDGQTANSSYKADGQAIFHNYTSPGRYNVEVTCSNYLGQKSVSVFTSADVPIGPLNITLLSQFPSVNSESKFELTISEIGTGWCFVISFGDGNTHGFAVSSICEAQFPGVAFSTFPNSTNSKNEMKVNISNKFKVPSRYSVVVEGWNSISKQSSQTEVFILRDRCTQPRSKIKYVGQTLEERKSIYRSLSFTLYTDNFIDCPAASGVTFLWRFLLLDNNKILFKDVRNESGTSPELIVGELSLAYGVYRIDAILTLSGTYGVSTSASGYIEIVETPLIAKIGGGSMMRRGFDAFILMDGSSSRDPDFEHKEDKALLFTWICVDVTGMNITAEDSPKFLVNGTYPTKNMEGKCFTGALSRIEGYLPEVVMDSSFLKSTGKEVVEMVLILIVTKGNRTSTHTQKLEHVLGKPPSLSTE